MKRSLRTIDPNDAYILLTVQLGYFGPGLRYRIYQEYSRNYFINQLLLMDRIFNGIFLSVQLFVTYLFHFFMEYSKNILHVKPHPNSTLKKSWMKSVLYRNPKTPLHNYKNPATKI